MVERDLEVPGHAALLGLHACRGIQGWRLAREGYTFGTIRGGGVVAWDGSRFTEVVYFTSEEEARKGEKSESHTSALEIIWPRTEDLQYFDLREPWFASPRTG